MTSSSSSFLKFVRRFMIDPVMAQKPVVVSVVLALFFLSVTQAAILLVIKGFFAAFFAGNNVAQIELGALLPTQLQSLMPQIKNQTVSRDRLVILIPAVIIFAGTLKALATYLYNLGMVRLSLSVAQNYRESIFAGILKLPWLLSSKRSPGEWMSVIMSDAVFIQSRLSDFSTAFVKDGVLIVSGVATLAFIHWPAAVVLLLLLPLIGWQMGRAGKRIAWFTEAFQRELGILAGQLLSIRERFRFVRAQQGEGFERGQFAKRNLAYLKMMNGSIFLRAIVAPGMEWVGFLLFAIFVYGWTHKIRGFNVPPDVLLQFFTALGLILRPIREMGEQVARWGETIGGLRRSMAVIEEVESAEMTKSLPEVSQTNDKQVSCSQILDIKKVKIFYHERLAFSGSNLKLHTGQSIAVIGPSGSGKSTLVRCLAGLIPPKDWDANLDWPQMVRISTLVSQSPFLFKDTIRSNLFYGLSDSDRQHMDENHLWDVLRTVNMEAAVKSLPTGFDSDFNPIQTNLSGGQIQRLVIARALLRNPKILMLDEATAAVDVATEKDISTRLIDAVRRDGTMLIAVTHRLRWLDLYDQVWFVEHGVIQLVGRHLELLNVPRYRQFVMQTEQES